MFAFAAGLRSWSCHVRVMLIAELKLCSTVSVTRCKIYDICSGSTIYEHLLSHM